MRGRLRAIAQAFCGGFRAELLQLGRSRLFLALTAIQAIAFLLLVSLFGLTGSRAPVALVNNDRANNGGTGKYASKFIEALREAHHSFAISPMDSVSAARALHNGEIVAVITIPAEFSESVVFGKDTMIKVDVDNIDTDMTDDVQRALPSAIVQFGSQLRLPEVRLHVAEVDLVDHDTGFIPYLVVSGLVLDAFVIAGILSAMTVAREFETGNLRLLMVAPIHPLVPIMGRVAATNVIAGAVMVCPVSVVVFGYHVHPLHPAGAVGVLLLCTAVFGFVGVALGAILKRTLPVAALVFGISLPLYLCSGSLEPERFDGGRLWILGHLSPVYQAVGLLEMAFHGLKVTPESVGVNEAALLGWSVGMLVFAGVLLRKQLT